MKQKHQAESDHARMLELAGMMQQEERKTMSQHAKGNEKYGKDGMQALRDKAQSGASEKEMDATRDKYDKYDEGAMSDLDADRKDRAYQTRQAKTTMKHVKDPTPGEKAAAKDIKPGVKGFKDRYDMLKSAERDGRLKEADDELGRVLKIAGLR